MFHKYPHDPYTFSPIWLWILKKNTYSPWLFDHESHLSISWPIKKWCGKTVMQQFLLVMIWFMIMCKMVFVFILFCFSSSPSPSYSYRSDCPITSSIIFLPLPLSERRSTAHSSAIFHHHHLINIDGYESSERSNYCSTQPFI